MVSRNHDKWRRRQSIKKRSGVGKLLNFGALGKIPAGHDHIGTHACSGAATPRPPARDTAVQNAGRKYVAA